MKVPKCNKPHRLSCYIVDNADDTEYRVPGTCDIGIVILTWIPACAGMTNLRVADSRDRRKPVTVRDPRKPL
jgi:hypothetical protein